MKVAAIIAEYNPFHKGHEYLIQEAKRLTGADTVIAILSGNFTERGEAACMSKELRTRICLSCGVDLVFLLPLPYATGSADLFALGAVSILSRLNCVDCLCFGSETGDIDRLNETCDALYLSDSPDNPQIRELMKKGMTYPKARMNVFCEYNDIISSPNNILALEYLKALRMTKSTMKPITIARIGNSYDDSDLPKKGNLASASSIRNLMPTCSYLGTVVPYVPASTLNFYQKEYQKSYPIVTDDFSEVLFSRLVDVCEAKSSDIMDVSDDLLQKMCNNLPNYQSFNQFAELLKTKDQTYTRICRSLIHILLNVKGSTSYYKEILPQLTHIQLLGLRDSGECLKMIKKQSSLSLVTKIPDALGYMNPVTRSLFDMERLSATLFDYIIYRKYGTSPIQEYCKPFIRL